MAKIPHSPAPFITEERPIADLVPHPRNYQLHPEDEIAHLMASITDHGIYRNIVVAHDGCTILAGHGVVEAARRVGLTVVPVYRTSYDALDPRALKLLVADNELSHLAEADDRALAELLREIAKTEEDLLGTGYDAPMLTNLVYVTRPASEIVDQDAAQHWVGLPAFPPTAQQPRRIQLILTFDSSMDRIACLKVLGLDKVEGTNTQLTAISDTTITAWWPARQHDDVRSVRFTDAPVAGAQDGGDGAVAQAVTQEDGLEAEP